jgi:hypothetical protein
MSAPEIFISYRRDDTRWAAAMICQALEWAFGREKVFFDRTTIAPGATWPETLRTGVEQCRLLVAVIGKAWLTAADEAGRARLLQEEDWVRRELRTVLQRADGPLVLPVFVDGAVPPCADKLPPDLAKLPERQGCPLREFPDFDHDIANVVEQIAARLGVAPMPFTAGARAKLVAAHYATTDGGNRQRMIGKVREAWIRGVLDKVLSGADSFTLGLDFAPTAVVQSRGLPTAPLLDSRNIVEVFEEFDRRLLVLGSPGAGKTILLLQLARRLLNDADHLIDAPIPVVLNLSSWAARRLPLDEWLVEDLGAVYQVPARVARDWVERQQLLLLLDGLDEVAAEHRAACVESINAHLETWPTLSIAVCSRVRDYEAIGVRLKLRVAVRLEALDLARVQKLIAAPEYAGVRAVAAREEAFREMLTMPFLLNLIRVAYRGESAERLTLAPGEDPAKARRDDLFETYIEARLNEADANSGSRKPRFYRRFVRRWLSWLAASMQRRGESIFYLEALQGSWLPTPVQRMAFAIAGSLVFGAVIGSIAGFAAVFVWGLRDGLQLGSLIMGTVRVGVLGALVFVHGAIGRMTAQPLLADWGSEPVSCIRPLVACGGIVFATFLILGLPFCALLGLHEAVSGYEPPLHPAAMWILAGIAGALYSPLLMLVFRGLHCLGQRFRWWQPWMPGPVLALIIIAMIFAGFVSTHAGRIGMIDIATFLAFGLAVPAALALGACIDAEIRMVEQLSWRWSWRGTALGAAAGLAVGCINIVVGEAISIALSAGLHLSGSDDGGRFWGDAIGCAQFALLGAALGGVWGGLHKSEHVAQRQRPGAGLIRTLRNVVLVNLGFTISGVLIGAVGLPALEAVQPLMAGSNVPEQMIFGAVLGASMGLLFGHFLGGNDALIKHCLLRFQLCARGCLPLRLIAFLDHATGCFLLRRVGAGYIFLHRYLLEHLASRCPPSLVNQFPH